MEAKDGIRSAGFIKGDIWSQIEFDFSEIGDLMRMRLETAEEARGKVISPGDPKKHKKAVWQDTAPRWEDPDVGVSVWPWLMIPYVHAVDQDQLRIRLEAGNCLLPAIQKRIAAREITPALLHDWGLLNRWAGALQLINFSKPDVGRLREAFNNLDVHKRWFAHYFLRIYKRGAMGEAWDVMERFINCKVKRLPTGKEREWFERFLSDRPSDRWPNARRLTNAFREDLSVAEMRRRVREPPGDLSSLDLDFPPP